MAAIGEPQELIQSGQFIWHDLPTIQGVWIKEPKSIRDARGELIQFLDDSDGDIYKAVYEVTFRSSDRAPWGDIPDSPPVVRAQHLHPEGTKTEYMRALVGEVFVFLIDQRKESETYDHRNFVILSSKNRAMVRVPAGVAHALVNLNNDFARIEVLATCHHDHTHDVRHQVLPTKGHFLNVKEFKALCPGLIK